MATEIVTKSQFAGLIQRDPAFVTRAIASGKIYGSALIGDGRSARINVALARQQLGVTLDVSQQLSQAAPILPLDEAPGILPETDDEAEGLAARPTTKAASAENIELRNRKLRMELERQERDDAVRDGQLVEAAAVGVAIRRQFAPLIEIFDQLAPAIAKAIAEQFQLDYPTVKVAVAAAVRRQRASYAEQARALGAPAEAEAA